jgi:hypothetical protein
MAKKQPPEAPNATQAEPAATDAQEPSGQSPQQKPTKIASPAGKKPGGKSRRRGKGAARVGWRRMARLADDALQAIAEGNSDRAREYLEAIRAVALVNAKAPDA